jgi:putative cell wall-binding protein
MRRRLVALVVALVALALFGGGVPVAAPAGAAGPLDAPGTPVWPGVTHHRLTTTLADGAAAVSNVVSFRPDDPALSLRPVLARGVVPGLETVPSMARRHQGDGAVVAINGGFWIPSLPGDPNGYLASGGELISEPETQGEGARGTFALRGDGAPLFNRVDADLRLRADGADAERVAGVNRLYRDRLPHPDDPDGLVYVYTPLFGPDVPVRGDLGDVVAFTVDDVVVPAAGAASGEVERRLVPRTRLPLPEQGVLVVAYGTAAQRLAGVRPGADVAVEVTLETADEAALPDWAQVVSGLAVGPLIVRAGAKTDPDDWFDEGFTPEIHSDRRHPRSAVAVTADGDLLLVTVDGRQPGYSAGMTLHELADHLIGLGARDALSLDGGGSSQLAVDGLLRNRPCCDAPLRAVADALVLSHDYTFEATDRIAGALRSETAAAVAAATHPDGADEVVLASALDFPDALAGGPLAAAVGGPVLLTARDDLPGATLEALADLRPRRVTLLGGPAAISDAVEATLAASFDVRRIAGRDRTETAAQIAYRLGHVHPRAVLAVAHDFADALSAAPPAALLGMPILLTATDTLSPATRSALRVTGVRQLLLVGGEQAVSRAVEAELTSLGIVVTRVSGPTRYATAAAINRWAQTFVPSLDGRGLVVARGDEFADPLAAGGLAAARRQLLQIVPATDVRADPDAAGYLDERAGAGLDHVTLLGGYGALTSYQQWQLDQLAR